MQKCLIAAHITIFSGWFSMVAGAYGIKAIAIDMQKLCVDLFRCSASLNRYNRHEIYHAYATDSKRAALNKKIVMPSKLCVGGTSPGAPGSGALSIGLYLCVLCMYVCGYSHKNPRDYNYVRTCILPHVCICCSFQLNLTQNASVYTHV